MSFVHVWLSALPALLVMAIATWAVATARRNVGLVDIAWSLFFLAALAVYAASAGPDRPRALLLLAIVGVWSLRLSVFLALRNWNAPEDHRYRAIRARNEPGFAWKSLYQVFGLQALLAWLISAPLAGALASTTPLQAFEALGAALAAFGIAFESTADAQLSSFKAAPANAGRVMDRGLWRYTRHPNYFGEFCVAWGLWLIAVGGGAWWTVFAPLLMSFLLLRVSGVALLEKDIGERRPAYRDYIARTNAFFPRPAATRMIRLLASILLLVAGAPASAETRAWNFRAYLDEREIGHHRFTLRGEGEVRELLSEARFQVRLLGFTAYRYRHDATERWRGDCLQALASSTDDDGERGKVDWREAPGACAMSFAYWHPKILQGGSLLNAQTGRFEAITVTPGGEENIEVRGSPTPSERSRLSGANLAIDIWYAGKQWVALESVARGGRRLRYRLI